ncbi:MAG TPA: GGDEF domain-containing protein [Gammaproteobacteria bacterium]|nr:GGDEF domain-containing protein [Gammaproteobacteria bacterium]
MTILLCSALVFAISLVDYHSGPDLTFSLFYFAVIALYSWKAGVLRDAVIFAFGIATVWLVVDWLTLTVPSATVVIWNATMRLIVLIGLAVIICRLRSALVNEHSLARSDFLTETLNARAFGEQATLEISRARRYRQPLTVAYVDVDDFKAINDRYGHCYGDDVLRSIAKALKANLRITDIVSRVGGDEFIILLPSTDREKALAVLSKLQSVLSAGMTRSEPGVTLSIGAVVFDEPPFGIEALKRESDAAMYNVKSNGKNGLCVYSSVRHLEPRGYATENWPGGHLSAGR